METYLIIGAVSSFIIGICQVLKLGLLIRLRQHKKLHPEATIKEIESFEKNTKSINYFLIGKINNSEKSSELQ
ncbi:hypothetical protein [Bizionia arctica]|uniref:Uncharacterized protein n=1 Tax=Bizionia arctica TaxID=1495645 RepID=A0A917LKY2_9FLAO|nr:hypothetical protein [Bizionia arctica]GGG37755.1 hypothetical protein GCM10010976_06830 [Bizionia arctica]